MSARAVVTLLDNDFFQVVFCASESFVLLRRRARSFSTSKECDEMYGEVVRKLDTLTRRRMRLLIDLRSAPGRNDPEFESVIASHRRRVFQKFMNAAVLVRTAAGRMQVARHVRDDGNDAEVFLQAAECLQHLGLTADLIPLVEP